MFRTMFLLGLLIFYTNNIIKKCNNNTRYVTPKDISGLTQL